MKYMICTEDVSVGDTVSLRDGSYAVVTDVPDPGPYETVDRQAWFVEGREVVTSSMPAETIFVGYDQNTHKTVVSDMSEIVSIVT